MIKVTRPAYFVGKRNAEYCGLSTDDKSVIIAENGDEFYAIDTGTTYKYDSDTKTWIAQPKDGFGGGDTPTMETDLRMNGHAIYGVNSISGENGVAIESELSLNNHKITDIAEPVNDNDAARKIDVDNVHKVAKTNEDNIQMLDDEYTALKTSHESVATRTTAVEDALPTKLTLTGGTMEGNIDMNSYALKNVQEVHVNGSANVFIGSTIKEKGTQGVRVTGTTAGEVAFVKPDTQNEYVPAFVGEPTDLKHAGTKKYIDDAIKKAIESVLPTFTSTEDGKALVVKDGKLFWGTAQDINFG